jgi:HEAT repeat protein
MTKTTQKLIGLLLIAIVSALVVYPKDARTQSESAIEKVNFVAEKLQAKGSFKIRLKAAVMLGRVTDPQAAAYAVNPLIGALKDDNYVVRGAAARALGNLGHPLAADGAEWLLQAVDDEEAFVQKEVADALHRVAGVKSLQYFISALSDSNYKIRLAAVRVLAKLNIPEAKMAIIMALGDQEEQVRAELDLIFKGLGRAEMESLLFAALDMEQYQVQAEAARLIGELKLVKAIDKLGDLLVSDDVVPLVKREATDALIAMRGQINVQLLIKQLSAEESNLRDKGIKLLGIQGGRDAVDALMALLRNQDSFIRRRAISALGEAGDPRAVPALEYLYKTENDSRTKEQITRTLRKLNP